MSEISEGEIKNLRTSNCKKENMVRTKIVENKALYET